MQNITAILIASPSGTQWGDAYGTPVLTPAVTVGVNAVLAIDLRKPRTANDDECTPYPAAELTDGVASYFIALDGDYDHATVPKLLRQTGIAVSAADDGRTLLNAQLPSTAHAALIAAVNSRATLPMHCEIGGLNASGQKVFSFVCEIELHNTIWDPSDTSTPEPDPADPDYLTSAQVRALVASEIANAIATGGLKGEKGNKGDKGDAGAAPVISVGEVTPGDLAANLYLDEDGTYVLDLTIPDPENPVLKIGEVTAGDAPAATFSTDKFGAYLLNLTVPRGASGQGINLKGEAWSSTATYAKGDALRHNGAFWYSKQDANTGHEPPSSLLSDEWWQLIIKDGAQSGLIVAFSPVNDHTSDAWHSFPYRDGDKYYRLSRDNGMSWGQIMPLAAPPIPVIYLFNPDNTTFWTDITPGTAYSTAYGAFCRAKNSVGVWSEAIALNEKGGNQPQELRLAFAKTPADGNTLTENDFHPVRQKEDDVMKVFTDSGVVLKTVTFNTNGVNIEKIQFCAIEDAWHKELRDTDNYCMISTDGGENFCAPVPFRAICDGDAPADDAAYARKNGQWTKLAPNQDDAPADGKFYARRNGAWFAIGNGGSSAGTGSGSGAGEGAAVLELPEHTERRIWEYLHLPYPQGEDAEEALRPQWQCSADGTRWSNLYCPDTDPETVRAKTADGEYVPWSAGNDAYIPVWCIPMESVHVRCAWARLEPDGTYTRTDWAYRNTLGVMLSPAGAEKPVCNIPEFLYCAIPENTDHAELHFADTAGSYLGQPIFRSDDPSHGRAYYFNGEDVVRYDATNAPNFPLSPTDGPFDGLYFIFNRRGLSMKCGLVWTGNNPVKMGWEL